MQRKFSNLSVFFPAIGNDRPVLVIYDGHSTHVDLNVIKLVLSKNIIIIKLPLHSSDTLQPLHCSGMKPMKDRSDEALVKWQRLHPSGKRNKHSNETHENNKVEYANLIFGPDVENNVETYDETQYDCTHQVVENQVYVTVPTLLSVTLQIFYKFSLEDIGSDGNCTEVKVTEHKEELVIEGNSTKVDMVGSKIEQEVNEGTMGITERNEGINTIIRKKEKLER
ncbi:unnamed protein product [Leptidea sinapis]|uniref:DDE-1 domain-containing protein n=1 Tax=Leptidea sinapis TaxID=189913 RepID=A0A5E4QEM8_9NEOP|nr:unnamed protein product [Leptidea sinapis]